MALTRPVFIVAAKRTPFGTFGGKLRDITATGLGVHSSKATLESSSVQPTTVNSVIFGNVIQSSSDAAYLARHIGLNSKIPITATALTVNRLCGSGFQAIVNGAQEIVVGDSDLVLVGGTESMSQAPYAVRDIRWGTRLGTDLKMEDTLWSGLTDSYCKLPMAITAENLAEKYNITREECDKWALQSQTRWAKANEAGVFQAEIAPMKVKGRKGEEDFSVDEHPRVGTDMKSLAKLPPVFKKDGTVTAGNASGICDGAASLLLTSEKAVKEHGLTPLARVVSYFTSGVDPSIMGIGPVPAIKGALSRAGKSLDDMDLVEVNEAFAAQFLAVMKELDLNPEKTNVCGGAIALGHPLGTSGARIIGHLVHELGRTGGKMAIGSACIGGGQGMAVVIENLQ